MTVILWFSTVRQAAGSRRGMFLSSSKQAASATPGDTATLAFEGTSISVYGTIADGEASLNFSIDGVVVGLYQSPEVDHAIHNLLFWTSPPLAEASHQLVVTVDQDLSTDSSNRSIFLDYFIYNTTSAAGKTVLFDDSDASLSYSPDWRINTDSDSSLQGTECENSNWRTRGRSKQRYIEQTSTEVQGAMGNKASIDDRVQGKYTRR
ncbi:hypothetical protein K438DRAFT_1962437 [Mycena galopus ATCC 62051]|nr:hypothetical protein K438DRAFT_1962437 [Mycena galopus ATCC 62051]